MQLNQREGMPLVRAATEGNESCRSSVVEHRFGKAEVESSILSDSTISRFWQKIKFPLPSKMRNACWLWVGSRDRYGYGQFKEKSRCPPKRSHRFVWQLFHGSIPAGAQVLHSCDNPACCNPLHLRLGSHVENMEDKRRRGRVWKGGPTRKMECT